MKFFCAALSICFLAVACKKDDDKPGGPTKTDLLVASSWKYDNGGIDQNGDGISDFPLSLTGQIQPCMTDNTGTFNSNGTGVADEGPTKCNANDQQSINFTWQFSNNETEMNVSSGGLFGLGGKFKVKELTGTKLTVAKDTTYGTMPVTLIVDLKH